MQNSMLECIALWILKPGAMHPNKVHTILQANFSSLQFPMSTLCRLHKSTKAVNGCISVGKSCIQAAFQEEFQGYR